jgi:peptidoglycan/LPS O-acetylase OafA/YrhL
LAGIVAAASGLLGLTIQATWLTDPNPALNWTLPRAHHFNAAGYYHAAYLVIVASVSGGLAAIVLQRVRHNGIQGRPQRLAAILSLAAYAAFVVLLVIDNVGTFDTVASASTALGVCAAIIGTVILALGKKRKWTR